MKPISKTATLLLLLIHSLPALAVPPEWQERWRSDLRVVRTELPKVHPSPFDHLAEDEFDRELRELGERVPQLSHGQIMTELARIIARIGGDGHTRLSWPLPPNNDFVLGHSNTAAPSDPSLIVHLLPVRLGVYSDGVFVERLAAEHRQLLGAELLAIDGVGIQDVITRVTPVISHDNPSQLLDLLPLHLVIGEVLQARGITRSAEQATFRFRRAGKIEELTLRAAGAVQWVDAASSVERRPLSWKRLLPSKVPGRSAFAERHWFEWLPAERIVYLQFNESYDDPDETIFDFAARLRQFIAANPVEAVVIDLRYNFGGDNTLNQPLLHALIASDKLRGPGKVRVLIGRGTFSAAMMLAIDLEKHIAPIFLGELTGGATTTYGDSRRTVLPQTGITIRISTLFHQYAGAKDRRHGIAPHIEVLPTWRSVRAGVDEALDAALAPSAPLQLKREYRGVMALERSEAAVAVRLNEALTAGELDLARFGDKSPVTRVTVAANRLTLESTLGGKSFVLEGVTLGNWIVGHALYDNRKGLPLPFAMR